MKKFILKFNYFNKLYWKNLDRGKTKISTTRSMGKTIMVHTCFEYLCKNYIFYYKNFMKKYEKIDNWRNNHKRKNII